MNERPMEDFTPEWARHVVWYQIFPERFANGDPSNDPTADSLNGALHGGPLHPGWRTHPWTSDWYALQAWERASVHIHIMLKEHFVLHCLLSI